MWLAIRLEYCTSLCRLSTSAIVVGSAPDGFHMWTAKISEFLRGLSSKTASVGVFDRMPPSQYSSPSIRTAGNAGGSAPDAMMCFTPSSQSRLSKYRIWLVRTCAAPTVSLGVRMIGEEKVYDSVNILFGADLRQWTEHRPAALYFVEQPELRGTFLTINGTDRWGFLIH